MSTVRVVVLVPYRVAALQNREHHLTTLLASLPRVLNEGIGERAWAILVIEQSDDGRKFSRGRCLNAGARIAATRYPGAKLVLHDVDLLPCVTRAKGYVLDPPPMGVLALNSDSAKYGQSEQYIGGVCVIAQTTFEAVNGFQNVFEGWGGEDDCLRDAIKSKHAPSAPLARWLQKYTAGSMTDLELADPSTCARACDVPEYRSDKTARRAQRSAASASGFADGYAQLVFQVVRERTFPDIDDNVRVITVHVHVTLDAGWVMGMSRRRGVPYYFRLLTGESTFTLPGTAHVVVVASSSKPEAPKRRRVSVKTEPTTPSLAAFLDDDT